MLDENVVNSMQKYRESSRFIRGIIADMGYNYKVLEYIEGKRSFGKTNYSFYKMLSFAFKGLLSFTVMSLIFCTFKKGVTVFS